MRGKPKRTYGSKARNGRMSDSRFSWIRTNLGQFVAFRYEKPAEEPDPEMEDFLDTELGPSYVLIVPRPTGGRPIRFNLTSLTEEELVLTRQFLSDLFDLALPVVRHRDKVAKYAEHQGDDSYARIYRAVPQRVDRKGSFREDDERILQRSWDSLVGAGGGGTPDGGLRGVGDELAPGEQEESRAQDDGPETDES